MYWFWGVVLNPLATELIKGPSFIQAARCAWGQGRVLTQDLEIPTHVLCPLLY